MEKFKVKAKAPMSSFFKSTSALVGLLSNDADALTIVSLAFLSIKTARIVHANETLDVNLSSAVAWLEGACDFLFQLSCCVEGG